MKTIEPISIETQEKLKAIQDRIAAMRRGIEVLKKEADLLVPKHTLAECREFGCEHTRCGKYVCQCADYCVRSHLAHGATRDCFMPKPIVIKPKVEYPTLGWKAVARRGFFWDGEWRASLKVVKETPKTVVLEDGDVLLKSTLRSLEDVRFIRNRMGTVHFCADSKEILDTSKMLLDIEATENREAWERRHLKAPDVSAPREA